MWKLLENKFSDSIWIDIYNKFKFDKKKKEVIHVNSFLCWSTYHLVEKYKTWEELENSQSIFFQCEINTRRYLSKILNKKEMFALDLNHDCYQIYFDDSNLTEWKLFFIPDGTSHKMYISKELEYGFFCNNQEYSITAFGDYVLSVLNFEKMPCKGIVLRKS